MAGIRFRHIYFIVLAAIVVAMPLSNYLMSVGQFALLALWLFHGPIKNKFKGFYTNPAAIALSLLFVLHALSLLYSEDLTYGWKDLRTKLPLLVFPILLSDMPAIGKKQLHQLLSLFIAAVVAASITSIVTLFSKTIGNIREISIFISHIRFGLMIDLSIFFAIYLFFQKDDIRKIFRWGLLLVALYLFGFLFVLQSLNAITILVLSSEILLIIQIIRKKHLRFSIPFAILVFGLVAGGYLYTKNQIDRFYDIKEYNFSELESHTEKGNLYFHDSTALQIENGHRAWIYICESELRGEWNKRSNIDFDGKDQRGQKLSDVLIRYLTSKGLRKDASGIAALSGEEVQLIEQGTTNYRFKNKYSIGSRLYDVIWGYYNAKTSGKFNGHSILQRAELWRVAAILIAEKPLFGIGTGDVQSLFSKALQDNDSPLSEDDFNWHPHNQFLSLILAMGFFGFSLFMIFWIYAPLRLKQFSKPIYISFFLLIILSFFTEDTLETQAGATLFSFFNSFLLLAYRRKEGDTI